jgi:hypothetical protein
VSTHRRIECPAPGWEGKRRGRGEDAGERRCGPAMARERWRPEVGGDLDKGSQLSARGRERRG